MEKEVAMLGVIKVVVKRVSRIGESYTPEGTSNEYQEPPTVVPESKLKGKAISHRTKYINVNLDSLQYADNAIDLGKAQ